MAIVGGRGDVGTEVEMEEDEIVASYDTQHLTESNHGWLIHPQSSRGFAYSDRYQDPA